MATLRVLNVGHGDSVILSPHADCKYCCQEIMVDVGDGKRDISKALTLANIVLTLSHSHVDHIGGLSWLVTAPAHKSSSFTIDELWIPRYWDEFCAILSFILKLRGVDSLPLENGDVARAQSILHVTRLIAKLTKELGINIKVLSEGDTPCSHITVYNPPVSAENALMVSARKLNAVVAKMKSTNYAAMGELLEKKEFDHIKATILSEGWSSDTPRLSNEQGQESFENRQKFILGMLNKLAQPMQSFVGTPSNASFRRVANKLKLSSNNASLVFKYADSQNSVLFAGDAGLRVFKGIIRQGKNISAEILKIPHHGSCHNINQNILARISPKVAVVSHNNRRFGRSKDTLPNQKIVDLLKTMGINTIYTNDVVKKGICVASKPTGRACCLGIEYLG